MRVREKSVYVKKEPILGMLFEANVVSFQQETTLYTNTKINLKRALDKILVTMQCIYETKHWFNSTRKSKTKTRQRIYVRQRKIKHPKNARLLHIHHQFLHEKTTQKKRKIKAQKTQHNTIV